MIPASRDPVWATTVALVPSVAAASSTAAELLVAQLTLTRPKLDRRILLVWRPAGSPPAARALLALARHHLEKPRRTPAR
jgi:DNA-binding transcriptional LysR family regulator